MEKNDGFYLLRNLLKNHVRLIRSDATLAEEMSRTGSHALLIGLAKSGSSGEGGDNEENDDESVEIQDLVCEALSFGGVNMSRSLHQLPFSYDELVKRLPLSFWFQFSPVDGAKDSVSNDDSSNSSGNMYGGDECKSIADDNGSNIPTSLLLLVHQVSERQSCQDDVGFVTWPSAVILSRFLIANPTILVSDAVGGRTKSILEIGSGCGLVGLTAAAIVRKWKLRRDALCDRDREVITARGDTCKSIVTLTDFNVRVLANIERNLCTNELSEVASSAHLDFYIQKKMEKCVLKGSMNNVKNDHSIDDDGSSNNGKYDQEIGWICGDDNDDDDDDDDDDGDDSDRCRDTDNVQSQTITMEKEQQSQQKPETRRRRKRRTPVDIILGADVICRPSDSIAVAQTIFASLKSDGVAYIVSASSKHRFGVDTFKDECERVGLEVETMWPLDTTSAGAMGGIESIDAHFSELFEDVGTGGMPHCSMGQTAGYIDSMSLIMFRIKKGD